MRAYTPAAGGLRYLGAAGQVVYLHGGTDGGNLELDGVTRAVVREGLIVVRFLFPGSSWRDPATGVLFAGAEGTFGDVLKLVYSLPTRDRLSAFALTADVATMPETRTFWGCREKAPGWVNAAAILELADRVHTGNWAVNLPGLLVMPPP